MTTLKDNSSETDLTKDFQWLMDTWVREKKFAKKTHDYSQYIWFLKEVRKNFSKVYAGFTNEAWIEFMGKVLKLLSCELKESIIISNNPMEITKKKAIGEMTNEELASAYKKGTKWLKDKAQVTGSTKNEAGEEYNDDEWQRGLKRIEKIETEMQKRGLAE